MKRRFFSYLVAGAALSFAACQGSGDGTDTTSDSSSIQTSPEASTSTDKPADTNSSTATLDDKSRDFVLEAASGGMMEVELGQLAQQKATTQRVKDFGAMMVRDHNKANDDLKNTVSGKVSIPATMNDEHQHHVSDLREKQGIEFDKAYIKMMVDDHEKDISKFESIAKDANDPALKSFADNTLPTLRTHLDSAKAIRTDLSKMKK